MTSDVPVRETYGLMPAGTEVVMFIVLLPFAALFIYGVYSRLRIYGREFLKEALLNLPHGVGFLFNYAFIQRKIASEAKSGVMHLSIYFGILALLIGTLLVALDYDILRRFFGFTILKGDFYLIYELTLDVMGLVLLVGLGLLLYRRLLGGEIRLRPKLEYLLILAGLLFITVTGYLLEGLRLYLLPRWWGQWSIVGYWISNILTEINAPHQAMLQTYQALWWAHALTAFTMVALLPYMHLSHIIVSALNVYFGGWMHEQIKNKRR